MLNTTWLGRNRSKSEGSPSVLTSCSKSARAAPVAKNDHESCCDATLAVKQREIRGRESEKQRLLDLYQAGTIEVKEIEVRLAGLRAKIKRLIDECTLVCSILGCRIRTFVEGRHVPRFWYLNFNRRIELGYGPQAIAGPNAGWPPWGKN